MDATTFKVMEALAGAWAAPMSIRELAGRVKRLHGTAHYANIYRKVQALAEDGTVRLQTVGRSSGVSLGMGSRTVRLLAEMETERKSRLMEGRPRLGILIDEIESGFRSRINAVSSVSIVDAERNLSLNRAELLFLLAEADGGAAVAVADETEAGIHALMAKLQKMRNLRLDYLIVKRSQFIRLLRESYANPLKSMLPRQVAFFRPQDFWTAVKEAGEQGAGAWNAETVEPARMPEMDMAYNLDRFGYTELGRKLQRGADIRLEYVIVSILIKGDTRRLEAIPTLLAKNPVDYGMLFYLCKKYKRLEGLMGTLKAFTKARKDAGAERLVTAMQSAGVRPSRFDAAAAVGKMRLYGAD